MRALGVAVMLLSVAIIAEQLPDESDQAGGSESLPLFSFPITPDLGSGSYDNNIVPVDINPVASMGQFPSQTIPFWSNNIISSDSKIIAQEPSHDWGTESTVGPDNLVANLQTGPDSSDPSCNSVSTTTDRKLRRQMCSPPGDWIPLREWINRFLDLFRGHATEQDPEGAITEEEKKRNDLIWEEDGKEFDKRLTDPVDPSLWESLRKNRKACSRANPKRPEPLCCLGPPVPRPYGQQKRAQNRGDDMQNCLLHLDWRPFCTRIGLACQYCCKYLDHRTSTFWGFIGHDCESVLERLLPDD